MLIWAGCFFGFHSVPLFFSCLSVLFLVSTEVTGLPRAWNVFFVVDLERTFLPMQQFTDSGATNRMAGCREDGGQIGGVFTRPAKHRLWVTACSQIN